MRRQVMAEVALRIEIPSYARPLSEVRVAPWAHRIVQQVVAEAAHRYPNGLPPPPHSHDVLRGYMRRAGKLFDDKHAGQDALPLAETTHA